MSGFVRFLPSAEWWAWYDKWRAENAHMFTQFRGETVMGEDFTIKDSGKRQEFASGMKRDVTTDKTLWHLVASGPMLKRWAEHLTGGAKKYEADNWMKANSADEMKRFRESAFRHFMQWFLGDRDEDHAAAVIFNINGAEYVREQLVAKAKYDLEFPPETRMTAREFLVQAQMKDGGSLPPV